ncbi:MAG: septal ring lytic transglycosylase RlpA family protein [Pseudolabrys sp.]|jgi:rare lipoprotein A
MFSSASFWNFVRMLAVTLTSAVLAACAQSSVTKKSELRAASRQVSLEERRNTPSVMNRGLAAKTNKHTPFAANKNAAEKQIASYGLASFYSDEQQTANGEKFNPNALTAAHPTLPFGTQLRVTNVATGRSVTVRVNDRGPFVPGRIVDVSYSAAETLGIVGRGVAKVKLDVIQ